MTQQEKELALRIFEKAMEDKERLARNDVYAVLSVKAAKAIYSAIQLQEFDDIMEEEKAREAERAADAERREHRKAEMKEAQKNSEYYIVFKHTRAYNKSWNRASVSRTNRLLDAFLKDVFQSYYEKDLIEAGVYKISKEDADTLLSKYKESRKCTSKYLVCESKDDFIRYVSECKSAERIDLTGYRIGNAELL